MKVLTPREASIFACLTDTVVAPAPPLPPVAATDAVAAFDEWLARAPRPNRLALRAVLYAVELAPRLLRLGGRLRTLDGDRRLEALLRVGRIRGLAEVAEALRGTAAMSYYGDEAVARMVGYDAARRT